MRLLLLCVAVLSLLPRGAAASDASIQIRDVGQGAVIVDVSAGPAVELSGVAWLGGNAFLAVGDGGSRVDLDVVVDLADGEVQSAAVASSVALPGGDGTPDSEGVAVDTAGGTFWVSDEEGPALRSHALATSAVTGTIALPAVFSNIRSNLSLESLARAPDSAALWTTTEQALLGDGATSGLGSGTTVRLQRFDASGQANGQWAYTTDPIPGTIGSSPFTSGVSDLLALPDGDLIVLERALGTTGFRVRLYRVDFAGATDTSALAQLDGASFTPVTKTLLLDVNPIPANFEGLALGVALTTGERSLLLVSDNGGSGNSLVYPLALRSDMPLPVPAFPHSGPTRR